MPDGVPGFDCRLHRDGDTARVVPVGELDIATVGAVEEGVETALGGGVRRLVLDLGQLTFMASTGLRLVLQLVERTQAQGLELVVAPGPPAVQRVFELTGTEEHVPWAPN